MRTGDCVSAAVPGLPPLDKPAVQAALRAVIGEDIVGGLIRVNGADGPWEATAGSAEAGRGRPVDPRGFFRIGSITKPFVATVVLQLAAEGQIVLDEPVQRQAPGLLPPGYPPVTVRQLLQHTSGVPNYLPHVVLGPEQLLRDRLRTWTPEELLEVAFAQPRLFEPGAELGYSNTNYVLLGRGGSQSRLRRPA
jgi:D-alanyl-D-alanine carboxypeptidase